MNDPDAGSPGADELQLPVLGLYADLELGRGSVLLPDEFLSCPGLLQLQILHQWRGALARYEHEAMHTLRREISLASPALSPAELEVLLRSTCEAAGIEVVAGCSGVLAES